MKKSKPFFILSALLLVFVVLPVKGTFAASHAAEVPLTVSQKFQQKGNDKNADLTGSYTFRALDKNIPMPKGSKDGSYSFSLKGKEDSVTLRLSYTAAGTYRYELFQATEDKKLYTYDKSRYSITVYVEKTDDNSLTAQVIATKEDGKKYGSISFQNICTGTYPAASTTPAPGSGGGGGSSHIYGSSYTSPVKTGDNTNITSFLFTGSAALFLIGLLLFSAKKNRTHEK